MQNFKKTSMKQKENNIKYIISLFASIIIAGSGYFLSLNQILSVLLIIIGGIGIIITVTLPLFTKYITPLFKKKKDPITNYTSKENTEHAKQIYSTAREIGGTIYATHIYQNRVPFEKDFATQELKLEKSSKINFNRIIIYDNQLEEKEWMKGLFELKGEFLVPKGYFWKFTNIDININTIGLIPRINLLLFENTKKNTYRSLIGFEKVRSEIDKDDKNRNFGLYSEKKEVFELLKKYYSKIQTHSQVESAIDFGTYNEKKNSYHLKSEEQYALKQLINYAQDNNEILHLGAFGLTALLLNNLTNIKRNLNHESDIDVLFVTSGNREDVIKDIKSKYLNDSQFDIIDGDDKDYFYHFRKTKKITIDIEVFEIDSNFYSECQLLGYSIFSNYYTLYSNNYTHLSHVLDFPVKPTTFEIRKKLFLEDRKGLNEFIEKVKSDPSNTIDPRRILAIVIKNYCWLHTGFRPFKSEIAINYLVDNRYIDYNLSKKFKHILGKNDIETKKEYKTISKTIVDFMENIQSKTK